VDDPEVCAHPFLLSDTFANRNPDQPSLVQPREYVASSSIVRGNAYELLEREGVGANPCE
jgi:hypothetical protein